LPGVEQKETQGNAAGIDLEQKIAGKAERSMSFGLGERFQPINRRWGFSQIIVPDDLLASGVPPANAGGEVPQA